MGRVLTLVISRDSDTLLEESIEAANAASHEHPCRVIVVAAGDADADDTRLDAQIRVGGDAGAGEVVVLRLSGQLADHANSVVMPFLLPDIPVVAWWPDVAPAVPAQDPLGKLAIRRITDATNGDDPLAAIKSRLHGYTRRRHRSGLGPHHLLAGAADLGARPAAARADQVGAGVRSAATSPRSTSWRAGWPAGSTVRCGGRSVSSRSSWSATARPSR